MRSTTTLAVAIAAVLGTSAASAAVIPQGGPFALRLVYSGSSAAQATFAGLIAGNCQAGTLSTYNAIGPTKAYQAYTCKLNNNPAAPPAGLGAAANLNSIFYYRADDGSVAGVGPFSPSAPGFVAGKGAKINRLDDTAATCVTGDGGVTYSCTIGAAYNGVTDAVAPGLVKDFVNVGVSDVEPAAFSGENWGLQFATWIGPDPGKAVLSAIPAAKVIDQVFELLSSNAAVTNLSRYSAANIFNGNYSDWSGVPTDTVGTKALNGHAGGGVTGSYAAGAITVCRRDQGSGTQASASILFEDQGCNSAANAFVVPPKGPGGNPVIINAATGTMLTCLSSNANAIGFAVVQKAGTLPAGVHEVTLDGIPADQARAALGIYPWNFELTENKLAGSLAAGAQTDAYTALLDQLSNDATDPASVNLVSVPSTINTPTFPLTYSAVNNIPIALGSRNGNSCSIEEGVL